MVSKISISQKQTPTFRAAIKSGGDWFDKETDLATQAELTTEGISAKPIAYTVYKSNSNLAPYKYNTAEATVVTGYENIEIASTALIEPDEVEEDELDYNFQFTPASRSTFPFANAGQYFVDFLLYPKTGAAVAFRVGVEVS